MDDKALALAVAAEIGPEVVDTVNNPPAAETRPHRGHIHCYFSDWLCPTRRQIWQACPFAEGADAG
jgi:hypothetical protein